MSFYYLLKFPDIEKIIKNNSKIFNFHLSIIWTCVIKCYSLSLLSQMLFLKHYVKYKKRIWNKLLQFSSLMNQVELLVSDSNFTSKFLC